MTAQTEDVGTVGTATEPRTIRLRYPATCGCCGADVVAGSRARWDPTTRTVTCIACVDAEANRSAVIFAQSLPIGRHARRTETASPVPTTDSHASKPVDIGTAGASLQATYDRRSAAREAGVMKKHPRLGKIILAFTSEPQSTESFRLGAIGERSAAAEIKDRVGPDVLFLLNRSLGHARRDGDLDMLAVGPSGVFVIDVKRYAKVELEIRQVRIRREPSRELLFINGRDRTKLLVSMQRQVAAVQAALSVYPGGLNVPVTSVMCFVDARLPRRHPEQIAGTRILGPDATRSLVACAGGLTAPDRVLLHEYLARQLPIAT